MADIQITDMTVTTSFPDTAVIAIEDNGSTYKLTGASLAAALKTIGSLLSASDLKANLTTSTAGSPLDATQGKALADMLNSLITNTSLGTYTDLSAAANAIWADITSGGNPAIKIGRLAAGRAYVYIAYGNGAGTYGTILFVGYGVPLVKYDQVNGTVTTQTYSYT